MKKFLYLLIIFCCIYSFANPSKAEAYNVILNSGYEIWFDSVGIRMPFAWYTSEVQDSGTATRTTDMHSGIYALQLMGSDTMAYAMTLSFCTAGHYYYFSGWSKATSYIAGSYIVTWLKLSQQPLMDPVIIPILRHTSYYNNTQMVQAPDSAVLVNVDVVALPSTTVYIDDVTLSDTVLTGVEENHLLLTADRTLLKVYPNPAKSAVHLSSPIPINQIELYDITGKIIQRINRLESNNLILDIRNLQDGVYFLTVNNNHNQSVQKFIVQR